jgi:hypothetical protein
MTDKTLSGALVTGNFQISGQMFNGKTISVSGYLYEGESVESVNERVSLFHDIVDTQRLKAELEQYEVEVDKAISRLEEIKMHYAVILEKQKNGKKLNAQEQAALTVMATNVDKHKEDIKKGEQKLKEAKEKLGIK